MSTRQTDTETFHVDVLANDSPTVVAFSAVWCTPCRVLDGQLQLLAGDHPELDVLVVDVDENETLAERYEVRTVPTVMLFRDGAVEQVMTGPMTKRLLEIGLGLGPPQATSGN
jgi:thioredoxin 1